MVYQASLEEEKLALSISVVEAVVVVVVVVVVFVSKLLSLIEVKAPTSVTGGLDNEGEHCEQSNVMYNAPKL